MTRLHGLQLDQFWRNLTQHLDASRQFSIILFSPSSVCTQPWLQYLDQIEVPRIVLRHRRHAYIYILVYMYNIITRYIEIQKQLLYNINYCIIHQIYDYIKVFGKIPYSYIIVSMCCHVIG